MLWGTIEVGSRRHSSDVMCIPVLQHGDVSCCALSLVSYGVAADCCIQLQRVTAPHCFFLG